MEPEEYEFEFPRGDTCPISFELTDMDKNELDMSDSELIMTVRTSQSENADIVFTKKYSSNDIEVNGKEVTLAIDHEDTANLKMNTKYYYDIQFTSGNYYKTLVLGNFKLTQEITY